MVNKLKTQGTITGTRNDSLAHPRFGQKFLGVAPGGVVDFYGQDKLSWTKLTRTIEPAEKTFDIKQHGQPKGSVLK